MKTIARESGIEVAALSDFSYLANENANRSIDVVKTLPPSYGNGSGARPPPRASVVGLNDITTSIESRFPLQDPRQNKVLALVAPVSHSVFGALGA
jgi:hypothetical protein